MTAAYPTSLLSWTQRVNGATVWAADPNALAAEIDAVEQFVGLNPQTESQALTGATKNFSSMSARLSDAMLQRGHPYIELARNTDWNIGYSTNSSNGYVADNPYGTVNSAWPGYSASGGHVYIKDAGVWLISASQVWEYASSGWVLMALKEGSSNLRKTIFSYSQFPASGSNAHGERFQGQTGYTEATFVGRLPAGAVIGVASGNYTNLNPIAVKSMNLYMYWLRP